MKKVALYLRVSTSQQTVENQRLELERYAGRQDWAIAKVYEDSGLSGSRSDRPALQEMLRDAAKGKFGVLVVWKIDRLARSVADLLNILSVLRSHGVDFVSTTQAIDTTTSYGKMVMTFLGAIAEFERETIIERVKCGLQRAKAQGIRLGRPKVGLDLQRALALKQSGSSLREIAKELGVGSGTIHRALAAIPSVPNTPEKRASKTPVIP